MQNQAFASLAAPRRLNLGQGGWQDYIYDGRPYFVYTPANYHVGSPVPLVMMLHGCLQSSKVFAHEALLQKILRPKNEACNSSMNDNNKQNDCSFYPFSDFSMFK